MKICWLQPWRWSHRVSTVHLILCAEKINPHSALTCTWLDHSALSWSYVTANNNILLCCITVTVLSSLCLSVTVVLCYSQCFHRLQHWSPQRPWSRRLPRAWCQQLLRYSFYTRSVPFYLISKYLNVYIDFCVYRLFSLWPGSAPFQRNNTSGSVTPSSDTRMTRQCWRITCRCGGTLPSHVCSIISLQHRRTVLHLAAVFVDALQDVVSCGIYCKTVTRVLNLHGWYFLATEYLECQRCNKKLAMWSYDILDQLDLAHRIMFPAILTYRWVLTFFLLL